VAGLLPLLWRGKVIARELGTDVGDGVDGDERWFQEVPNRLFVLKKASAKLTEPEGR
jgi:hypothetical protein